MPSIKHVLAAARQHQESLHRKDSPWDIALLTRSGPRFHYRSRGRA